MQLSLFLLLCSLLLCKTTFAEDYVRLKNGRVIEGAVIRQDTLAVYLTTWEQRQLKLPELQVFARSELESIWIGGKPTSGTAQTYAPRVGLIEVGGGLGLQTWASTLHQRRYLVQVSTLLGTSVTNFLGLELAGDLTAPFSKKVDTEFKSLQFSYQLALHIVGMLEANGPFIPFAYVGAGIGRDVPTAGVTLTKLSDDRNLVDFGLGVKVGIGGVGVRTELRHAFYQWNKTRYIGTSNGKDYYTTRQSADVTSMRVSLFTYF